MFNVLGWGRRRRPNLGTLSIDPEDPSVQPPARVFISHRWDTEPALYAQIIKSLGEVSRVRVEDLSLTEDLSMERGPGGKIDPKEIRLRVANRIQQSDLVCIPATRTAADEDWIQFEIESAAQQGKPVLFVTERPDRERWIRYLALLDSRHVPTRTCSTDPADILWAIRMLLPAKTRGRAPDASP